MTRDETVAINVINDEDSVFCSIPYQAKTGFNQYRWDLVTSREGSHLPYFFKYKQFLGEGRYKISIETSESDLESTLVVTNGSDLNDNLP